MWHSGTLAAAKQAALLGLRGIAFSTPTGGSEPDFARLRPWVRRVLELLIRETSLSLVNVNLPAEPTGLCWTRQSVRHYDGRVVAGRDPVGREHYWITVAPVEEVEEETDKLGSGAGTGVHHPAPPRSHRPRGARPRAR